MLFAYGNQETSQKDPHDTGYGKRDCLLQGEAEKDHENWEVEGTPAYAPDGRDDCDEEEGKVADHLPEGDGEDWLVGLKREDWKEEKC